MVKNSIIAALLLSANFANALPEHQLLIPSRAAEFLHHFGKNGLLAYENDSAVVQVPESALEEWSEFVHTRFGLCGGFFDVSDVGVSKQPLSTLRKFNSSTMMQPYTVPMAVIFNEKLASLVGTTSTDFIKSFLTELSSFDDRSATTDLGTKASEFIAQKATQVGAALSNFQVRTVATRSYPKQPSVVATLQGTKPGLPHIVMGGHMDTLSNNKPGADDDGTGSAMVMEALRNIANTGARFERTIDFVWYAAEERGLVGSTNVVRDFKEKQINVAAAIQFDMTGWVNPNGLYEIYLTDDHVDIGLNQTLEAIIKTYLPTVTIGHAECGYACSDHASWTAAQVPAVYPFESHHEDYNRRIHTSMDKMDYLNFEHMTKFAKIGVAFLGQMAVLQ
jgi:leucyl aminopeptidase